ncbi:MAG: Ig-like domain-containing protein [Limisphaerales bacterium]
MAAGIPVEFPPYVLRPADNLPDIDRDGLPNLAELVIGTNPLAYDSDRDAVGDGAELRSGGDPLDGLPARTGVLSSADTPGTAVDVCAINNVAILADSDAGVAVFNVFNALEPVRIAQVDTPGNCVAVACSGSLIAAADADAGLAIIDISDPPAARIVRQLAPVLLGGGRVDTVATAADLGFVGTSLGHVLAVELATGAVLQRLSFPGAVRDLAVEGTTLYVFEGNRVHAIPFGTGIMRSVGSPVVILEWVDFIANRQRIFAGGERVYVGTGSGYATVDVSDPMDLRVLGSATSQQFGWAQVVPNGAGLGLGAVSVNRSFDGDVYVNELSNPGQTGFLTLHETPGSAMALAIFNGLAYVADREAGLTVVNYQAADVGGVAPTIAITSSLGESTEVTAGAFVVLQARVADDSRQVRHVEFQVNGERIAVDGNFPFEIVYRVPRSMVSSNLTFSATVFDTGGNSATGAGGSVRVLPDVEAPIVSIDRPAELQRFGQFDDVAIGITAEDNSGIQEIRWEFNGAPYPMRRVTQLDWIFEGDMPYGTNSLVAIAVDHAGLVTRSQERRIVVEPRAVSREVSVWTRESTGVLDHAISREVSIWVRDGSSPFDHAISRELSVDVWAAGDGLGPSGVGVEPRDRPDPLVRRIGRNDGDPR